MIYYVREQLSSGFALRTEGLSTLSHREISVQINKADLMDEAEGFLRYVSNYLIASPKKILSGESMAYGYWLVRFQGSEISETLETWEYEPNATNFLKGANLTLSYWREQHLICKQNQAEFNPPRPDKLTVISEGVLEGLPVEGVRYPSPDHMSGWWLTTDQYGDDIKKLKNEHTYHITASRPELAKYIALPSGFRFMVSAGSSEVWFDETVAMEQP